MTTNKLLLRCPKCGGELVVAVEQSGKNIKCPNCSQLFVVPDLRMRAEASPPRPAAPPVPPPPPAVRQAPAEETSKSEVAAFLYGGLIAVALVAIGLLGLYLAYSHRFAGDSAAAPQAGPAAAKPDDAAKASNPARDAVAPGQQTAARGTADDGVKATGSASPSSKAALAAPRELSTKEIVAQCEQSVAVIRGKRGLGSGFVVKADVIATNAHVIEEEFLEDVGVNFPSVQEAGNRGPFKVRALLYEDRKRDLAFLSVRVPHVPLELAGEHDFTRGESVVIIGSPKGIENAVTTGILSTKQEVRGVPWYQLSAPINRGNSGGAVLNSVAKVVGMPTWMLGDAESLNFCVPAPALKSVMDQLPSPDADQAMQATSRHRAALTFRRADQLCTCYGVGLKIYLKYLKMATEKQFSLQDAITAARAETVKFTSGRSGRLHDWVNGKTQDLRSGLEVAVSKVSSDPHVEQRAKDNLVELWTTCTELNSYYFNPRGSYQSLHDKQIELVDKYKRHADALRVLLGVAGE